MTPLWAGLCTGGCPPAGHTQAHLPGTSGGPLEPQWPHFLPVTQDPAERGPPGGLRPVPGDPAILPSWLPRPGAGDLKVGVRGPASSTLACRLGAALLQWGPPTKAVRTCGSGQGRSSQHPHSPPRVSQDFTVGAGLVAWRDPRSGLTGTERVDSVRGGLTGVSGGREPEQGPGGQGGRGGGLQAAGGGRASPRAQLGEEGPETGRDRSPWASSLAGAAALTAGAGWAPHVWGVSLDKVAPPSAFSPRPPNSRAAAQGSLQ